MSKKDILQIITSVAIGFLLSGLILIINRSQPKTIMVLNPPPTAPPIMVFISGEVENPDVYALPKGSRLIDLINAAGGLKNLHESPNMNLAAILYDGQHVIIQPQNTHLTVNETNLASESEIKININEATTEELTELPGIGSTKADAIVQYRLTNGPFDEIEDILNVPGIGEYTFELIKDLITINQIY
ncbi:MAG: hypothetical protein CL609_19455 [Anaerolineaceae bacterium]|nr:hypothetical protein [Anaerolineaceae bacterium]